MSGNARRPPRLLRPLSLFFVTLLIVFGIETVVMFLISVILPGSDTPLKNFADSCLLVLFSAPFVWRLVVRPLRAAALSEVTRAQAPLEHIIDAVICFDTTGAITSVNAAAGKLFGYPDPEILGQQINRLIPDLADRRELPTHTGNQAAPNFRLDTETTGRHRDGHLFPAEIYLSTIRVANRLSFVAIVHDIGERKDMEQALARQRDLSLRLVQYCAVPCFVLAPDHTVLVWNKACEELTGIKAATMLGTSDHWQAFYPQQRPTLADLVISDDRQDITHLYEKHARSPFVEGGLQGEGWYHNVGSKERYLFFDAGPVRNDNGELLAVIETLEDITDRKMTEEALRTSEDKFNRAFHASPDGIAISRKADGVIIDVNEAFTTILGYARDEVLGRSAGEIGLWVNSDERTRMIEQVERVGRVRDLEIRLRAKTGGVRTLLCSVDQLQLNGEACLIIIERDITAQKENERLLLKSKAELTVRHEQLTALFNQVETVKREWERTMDCINDMVILLDRQGKVKRCNRATAEFAGIPYEELLGADWQEAIKLPGISAATLADRGGEIYHEQLNRWFNLTCYPLGDDGAAEESGVVITIHDATETKQASMAVEQAYTELKEAQAQILQREKMASIGQLAAGIAHEINNPTGFIMSNLGTLGKYQERLAAFLEAQSSALAATAAGGEDELAPLRRQLKIDHILADIPSLIAESLDGAERVKKIVQDLKSFSRVDEADCKMANIVDCLESTINIVWNELKYKATLHKEYGELPPLRCYPQQLNQVFMNLLVNASHAIDKQGEITVRTWCEENNACIAIADTGCGIPEAIRSRIFEPFFTTKEVGKGTGLGLSISYDIIKKHGGDISLESEVGRGTTFTIRLPLDGIAKCHAPDQRENSPAGA
ncbi:hypothetical protein GURASL_00550 [Geotalea uraniireducens]|uniref:histidine kinase n=1 Tax=Geotalea uraniireducens TaxID=351604 RepID=A0ABM8EFG5_9BACT|nr:PAS domain S-box protein [Geotalea uraniireducens]BDV41132.1 hypothetical protein GURASL_00550 [Geotalea uraniireducens]